MKAISTRKRPTFLFQRVSVIVLHGVKADKLIRHQSRVDLHLLLLFQREEALGLLKSRFRITGVNTL